MKRLVEFKLEDGSMITMEVDGSAEGPTLRSARPGEVVEKARVTFDEALGKIAPVAESVIARLRGLIDPPEALAVEFGLKFSAEAGAIIASAATEANFKITLSWRKQSESLRSVS